MVTITKRANNNQDSGVVEVTFTTSTTPPIVDDGYMNAYPNLGGPNTRAQVFMAGITTGGIPHQTGTVPKRNDVWTTFRGITIPQGANIISAVLSIVHQKVAGTQLIMQANVWESNDAKVNNASTYPYGNTIYARFMAHTFGGAGNKPPLMMTTPTGTKREKVVFTKTSASSPTQWPNVTTHDLDVKNMVQRLVDQFAYVNQAMTFQLAGDFPNATQYTGTDLYAAIYTHYMYAGGFAPKVTTATSQGTSIYSPKLVIDYSIAATIDEEFTVDAIPLLGPYLRSCRTVDALLIAQGSVHGRCAGPVP